MNPRISVFTPIAKVAEKKLYLYDLLACMLAQTMPDWEWVLMTDIPEDYTALGEDANFGDERIRRVMDNALDRATQHPIPYLLNKFYPEARGEFIMAAFGDDLLDSRTFAEFTNFFDAHPDNDACYVSLQHQYVDAPGIHTNNLSYWLAADRIRGPGQVDCQLDGGQACIRKRLLDRMPAPWWPETNAWGELRHCDGLYLNNVVSVTSLVPAGDPRIPYLIHRFTPVSTFTSNAGVING